MGGIAGLYFTTYRSLEGWWERSKPNFSPEFVEEQRSKAA